MIVSATWTYGDVDSWLDARWNDAAAGTVLTVVGVVRLLRPLLTTLARLASILVGGWLIIAPFVAGYGFGADSTPATANDVLIGAVVTGLAIIGRI
ncbi:SPW repeat protein [Kibdelosporangium aridum]|uniref:SPW repeat domain-containing protein n=1 Tax=Kibdelosporangium aridum TaxID=2030 RepID=UPI00163CB9C7|nr:SPW repeat protein [Kibdelosporangium aridum]